MDVKSIAGAANLPLAKLAETFAATAQANTVLREATESYLKAAQPVAHPVHYPRATAKPEAQSYEWFVANDRIQQKEVGHGWALPHVRDLKQRLPYLPKAGHEVERHPDQRDQTRVGFIPGAIHR